MALAHTLLTMLVLVSAREAYAVEYIVTNNVETSPGGVRFTNEIGTPDSMEILDSATNFIWSTFQQNTPADRRDYSKVSLYIDNFDGLRAEWVPAYTSKNEIHVNATYLGAFSGDVKFEFAGIIHHEMTHVWQWNGNGQAPGGIIEGIADFVRLKANYAPGSWPGRGVGSNWNDGYYVTAYFLEYCDNLRNGFVAELNKKMRDGYSDDYFMELLLKPVDQLWREYKAQYEH